MGIETGEALEVLEDRAAQGTLPDAAHLAGDGDMDTLRCHPRFRALVEAMSAKARGAASVRRPA
ncbi:MAG: hypothetical protein K9H25_22120 [Rhodospirillum sp.]|nr:hypothetical protein [Rhodospirillum sp.]MCF8491801.1 hypothetical protein [Rhodospirillum sp.]MCF8501881.1 hypothetical protein [Rhodospirillum sp.]